MTKHEIYIRVSSFGESRDWIPIFATEPEKNLKKALVTWKSFSIPFSEFGSDDKAYAKLEVFEYFKGLLFFFIQIITNFMK